MRPEGLLAQRSLPPPLPVFMEFRAAELHDTSPLAIASIPSAMLFVPSVGGVSHTYDEHTEVSDIAQQAQGHSLSQLTATGIIIQQHEA